MQPYIYDMVSGLKWRCRSSLMSCSLPQSSLEWLAWLNKVRMTKNACIAFLSSLNCCYNANNASLGSSIHCCFRAALLLLFLQNSEPNPAIFGYSSLVCSGCRACTAASNLTYLSSTSQAFVRLLVICIRSSPGFWPAFHGHICRAKDILCMFYVCTVCVSGLHGPV